MVIVPAREKIGAGQSAEREVRAVRAAAYRLYFRLYAQLFHALRRVFDEEHILRLYLLTHIVICVRNFYLHSTLAVLRVQQVGGAAHKLFARLEFRTVVVADKVFQLGARGVARNAQQVEKSLVTFGVLGLFGGGQKHLVLCGELRGVDHLALSLARVHVQTGDSDARGGGVEIFKLQLAQSAAVYRVSRVRAETLDVEFVDTAADLFVRRESYADLAVRQTARQQSLGRRHYFGNARLVVRAEQGSAVGYYQRFAAVSRQLGKLRGRKRDVFLGVQQNIAAVVIFNELRFHPASRSFGRGIHVRDEAQPARRLSAIGSGYLRVNKAVALVEINVRCAHLAQFVVKHTRQIFLLFSAGKSFALLA